MARGNSNPHHDFSYHQRQGTMFPGRELPSPPVVQVLMGWDSPNSMEPVYIPPIEPLSPVPPPPSQNIAHNVWMLNCKHCGNFITNRSMKCTLFVRPDVQLFSSDAMPVNCSVYEVPSDAPRNRTCECLSQTLCCHGCGAEIGYMIAAPCGRCAPGMSSTPANPSPARNTNGHRFVFHKSEVDYEERLYVAGDSDVVPDARSQEVYDAECRRLGSTPGAHLPKPPPIIPGEFLFWHHFSRSGQIGSIQVRDDVCARASRGYRVDPVNGGRPNRIVACR